MTVFLRCKRDSSVRNEAPATAIAHRQGFPYSSNWEETMAEGKWISGLTPTMPVADAARLVLQVRLEVVRDSLPPALHRAEKDSEYVHQLRVGTRRAGAALGVFA